MEHITNGLKSVQDRALSYLQSPYVFSAVAIAAGLLIASATLAASHPALGEIVEATIITAGAYLLAFGLVGFGSFIAWNFARSAHRVWQEDILPAAVDSARQLAPGPTVSAFDVDLSPDVLIVSRPGETKEQFSARLQEARQSITPASWVVMLEFQNPIGAVYTHGGAPDLVFTREDAPFQADGFSRVAPEDARFVDETPQEFLRYVERFAYLFREWSPRKKVAVSPERAGRTVLEIVAPCLVPIFLFFAPSLFAQKASQVADALGTRIREIPEQGIRVEYEFETTTVFRDADGRKDYVDLLKSVPMYRDGGGGKLIAVYAGDRVVCRAPRVERTAERDAMRPYRATTAVTDEPVRYSMPDSLTAQEWVDGAKETFSFYQTQAWQSIRPFWGLAMYAFLGLLPLFIAIGGLMKYIAGTARTEGFYGLSVVGRLILRLHEASSGVSLLIAWAVTVVLLLEAFMLIVYTENSLWLLIFAWLPLAWIAKVLTNWWVPNPPQYGGLDEGRGYMNGGQRRIGP